MQRIKRLKHDAYQTPDWVVEQLCGGERPPSQIWEPCAGESQLARVLGQHGSKVIETDLDPRKRSQRPLDFLAARRPFAKAIVTNPPYRIATTFIRHALSLGGGYSSDASEDRRPVMVHETHRVYTTDAPLGRLFEDAPGVSDATVQRLRNALLEAMESR